MSFNRLWQTQGKHSAARILLPDIYSWFTEGFDTTDVQETKALLAGLAHQGLPGRSTIAGEDGSGPIGGIGVVYGGVRTPGSGLGARCVGARPVLGRCVAMAMRQGVKLAVSAFETFTPRLTQEEFPPCGDIESKPGSRSSHCWC
jgi:hypothetical protein